MSTSTFARPRLSLRDAVRLCGVSEKTLRRKLEAEQLEGKREPLDYGGFMWMIDAHSLAGLYPESRELQELLSEPTPSPAPPSTPLDTPPPPPPASDSPAQPEAHSAAPTPSPDLPTPSPAPEPSLHQELVLAGEAEEEAPDASFLNYLLEQNRKLQDDLKTRESQLHEIQARTMHLERELGEQRGTAVTQAKLLEWLQRQPLMLPPAAESAGPSVEAPQKSTWQGLTIGALSLILLLTVSYLLGHHAG